MLQPCRTLVIFAVLLNVFGSRASGQSVPPTVGFEAAPRLQAIVEGTVTPRFLEDWPTEFHRHLRHQSTNDGMA